MEPPYLEDEKLGQQVCGDGQLVLVDIQVEKFGHRSGLDAETLGSLVQK